jgi:DNA-binding NtrC family response regulator
MKQPRVLVCDDEMLIRIWLEEHLRENGYSAESVGDGTSLVTKLREAPADLVLLDLRLPDGSGIDFIPQIKGLDPELPVIMISAYGEVETAVAAVRAGAHHFLEKPIQLDELLLLVEQALERRRLQQELDRYRDGFRWQFSDVSLVGRSSAVREVAELVTRIGLKENPVHVLITGESGTGKDVVARAIHAQGPRRHHPFVRLNCTALPEHLVESELFGHESGAFTDARQSKKGLVELGDMGTLLLDEVGDMPAGAQAKLLGFLETKTFRRLGGVRDMEVDVHVLAATNRDLDAAVQQGTFREDLFYRLNVIPIALPPLRERPEDIAPLALHFTETLCLDLRQPVRRISREALQVMEGHDWPGNARELRNVLERVLLLDDEDPIPLQALPPNVQGLDGSRDRMMVLPAAGLCLDDLERELIEQAMQRSNGNKTAAARLLGLSRDTMRYRLEKHDIAI